MEQLLKKEENRGLLEGLEQASLRVENAKRELAQIEKQEMEARTMRDYINKLESRASEVIAIVFFFCLIVENTNVLFAEYADLETLVTLLPQKSE